MLENIGGGIVSKSLFFVVFGFLNGFLVLGQKANFVLFLDENMQFNGKNNRIYSGREPNFY